MGTLSTKCNSLFPPSKLASGVEVTRQTLKRKSTMSPSCMTYSFPSLRTSPFSLAAVIEPPQAIKLIVANHLGADKAPLKVRVDFTRRLRGFGTAW